MLTICYMIITEFRDNLLTLVCEDWPRCCVYNVGRRYTVKRDEKKSRKKNALYST